MGEPNNNSKGICLKSNRKGMLIIFQFWPTFEILKKLLLVEKKLLQQYHKMLQQYHKMFQVKTVTVSF